MDTSTHAPIEASLVDLAAQREAESEGRIKLPLIGVRRTLLINPEYIDQSRLPDMFKTWDVLVAPPPDPVRGVVASMCSDWISLNMLMLDEKRVICEKTQPSMVNALRDWGFEPIPLEFLHFSPFGGSFHCATLDVRRQGSLESYF